MDDIEVLVISDGSTDSTVLIAREYERSYPNTFHVIEKENGGYGSTVNRGILEAQGSYFKILDGDDWINGTALAKLVQKLKESQSDMFFMPKLKIIEGVGEESDFIEFKVRNDGAIRIDELEKLVGHWNMTVRTVLLKKNMKQLPEHTLYTDQLFVIQSIALCKSFEFFNEPVYCYRVGHDGQSVTKASRIAHLDDAIVVTELENELFEEFQQKIPNNVKKYLERRVAIYYSNLVRTCLLAGPSSSGKSQLIDIEKKAEIECLRIFELAGECSGRVKLLRVTRYHSYWILSLLTRNSWA